jgi:epoxyqueuosine reductase QueG
LDSIALKTTRLILSLEYKASLIAASETINRKLHKGAFPHKTAATRAGLGWIGKSALLITKEFGPRIRLVTILTDYPLDPNLPIEKSSCDDCHECVDICPSQAIKGKSWQLGVARNGLMDADLCYKITRANKRILNASVCGRCVSVCQFGREKKP